MDNDLRDSLKKISYTCSALIIIDAKARSIMNALEKDLQSGVKNLTESQIEDRLKSLKSDASHLWSTLAALIVYLNGAKNEIERKLNG